MTAMRYVTVYLIIQEILMANVAESPFWESGIYQLETADPVMGGENGIDNIQAKQLANRTTWLKQQLDH